MYCPPGKALPEIAQIRQTLHCEPVGIAAKLIFFKKDRAAAKVQGKHCPVQNGQRLLHVHAIDPVEVCRMPGLGRHLLGNEIACRVRPPGDMAQKPGDESALLARALHRLGADPSAISIFFPSSGG